MPARGGRGGRGGQNGGRGGQRGPHGGRGGHNGQNDESRMEVDFQETECHKCGQIGHVQRNCPQNLRPNGSNGNDNGNGRNTNGASQDNARQACSICHKNNHSTEHCFRNPENPRNKLPTNHGSSTNVAAGGNTGANTNNNDRNNQRRQQPRYVGFLPVENSQSIPLYTGDLTYCQICNSAHHNWDDCSNPFNHLSKSLMVCRTCGYRGHTEADCRHPDPIHCKVCFKQGHKAETCRDASAVIAKSEHLGQRDQRFRWEVDDACLHGGQLLQLELERATAQLGEDINMVDEEWLNNTRQAVADASVIRFPGQEEPLHHIPLLHANVVPAMSSHNRPFKITKPASSSRTSSPRSSSSASTRSHAAVRQHSSSAWQRNMPSFLAPPAPPMSFASPANHGYHTPPMSRSTSSSSEPNSEVLATLQHCGIDTSTFLAAHHQRLSQQQSSLRSQSHPALHGTDITDNELSSAITYLRNKRLTKTQNDIRAKIDWSKRAYRKQNFNKRLQELGNQISEQRVLSDQRHLALKFDMAKGYQFYRDPQVVEALVKFQKPMCHECGGEGVIVDTHLRPVDVHEMANNDGVKVLEIVDYEDWGLFVVFQCSCCNHGYSWADRLPLMSGAIPEGGSVVSRSSSMDAFVTDRPWSV